MEFNKTVLLILCFVCYAHFQEIDISTIVPKNYDAQMKPGKGNQKLKKTC